RDLYLAVDAFHAHPHARQRAGLSRLRRQVLVPNDRRRHLPGRVDGDGIHLLRQQRARHARLADHNARGPHLPSVVDHLEGEVGLVDLHTRFADVAVVPAPAFHVGDDSIDAAVVRGIELFDRASIQIAGRRQIVAPLIFFDGFSEFLIIAQIGSPRGVAAAPSQARLGQPEGRTRSPRLLRRRQRLLQPPRPPPCRQRRDAGRDAVGRKAGGDRLGAALASVPAVVDLGYSCKAYHYCYTSIKNPNSF